MLRRLLILMPGVLALGGSGCALTSDDADDRAADLPADMAPFEGADGSLSGSDLGLSPPAADAGPMAELQGFPANAEGGFSLDASGVPLEQADCYEPSTGLHCSIALCESLPICCVASTAGACCDPTADGVPAVTFDAGCTSLDCLGAGARAFGEPGPIFSAGLVAGGDTQGDGGVVFEPAIDLRNRTVVLSATIRPPTADCADGCFETIGLALLSEAPPSSGTILVRPVVALRYSGASGRNLLEAGGEVVHHFESEDPAGEWTLEVTPDGNLRVLRGGTELLTLEGRVVPAPVFPAVVGRTRNPSATGGEAASLGTLEVRVSDCDMPTGWSAGVPLDFTEPPAPSATSPSLLLGDPPLLAVEEEGALALHRRSLSGRFDPLSVSVAPGAPGAVHEPVLVQEPDGSLAVLALDGDGAVLRGVLEGYPDTTQLVWDAEPLVAACDGCERRSPTTGFAVDGTRIVIALEDGAPQVYAGGGAPLVHRPGPTERLASAIASTGDESLQAIALGLHAGAWRLHVTYARGTRSLVRLFVSEELIIWRALGRVYGPSGEGFDSLHVWSFGVSPGTEAGLMQAVYVGGDGVDAAIGTSFRPAP